MKKLKIVVGVDNPILRKKSVEVKQFDVGLKKFGREMKDVMADAKGLGLAAPQVGQNIRMILVTLGYQTDREQVVTMVNPRIVKESAERECAEEGCLSLPGQYQKVERASGVQVEFFDLDGGRMVLDLDGLDARVVQHEIDHLEGVLFVDRVEEKRVEKDLGEISS